MSHHSSLPVAVFYSVEKGHVRAGGHSRPAVGWTASPTAGAVEAPPPGRGMMSKVALSFPENTRHTGRFHRPHNSLWDGLDLGTVIPCI